MVLSGQKEIIKHPLFRGIYALMIKLANYFSNFSLVQFLTCLCFIIIGLTRSLFLKFWVQIVLIFWVNLWPLMSNQSFTWVVRFSQTCSRLVIQIVLTKFLKSSLWGMMMWCSGMVPLNLILILFLFFSLPIGWRYIGSNLFGSKGKQLIMRFIAS